jgi:hypothetical protein
MFAPNFDPLNPAERAPAAARVRFVKKRLSKLTSILDPILVPTWPHFAPQLGPKIAPKSFQEPYKIDPKSHLNFDRFFIDFWSISEPQIDQKSIKTP